MKYKKLWALAGIALSCNLLLTACYSNSSSKIRDKDGETRSEKETF